MTSTSQDATLSSGAALLRMTRIAQVMTSVPHTIGSEQKLAVAHRLMREHELRHLPVLRAGKLVGVLSERDLLFLETVAAADVDIDTVAAAMTSDVYTVEPEAALRDVVRTMWIHKYGCAVVVEDERLLGIFTATDALRHLFETLASFETL